MGIVNSYRFVLPADIVYIMKYSSGIKDITIPILVDPKGNKRDVVIDCKITRDMYNLNNTIITEDIVKELNIPDKFISAVPQRNIVSADDYAEWYRRIKCEVDKLCIGEGVLISTNKLFTKTTNNKIVLVTTTGTHAIFNDITDTCAQYVNYEYLPPVYKVNLRTDVTHLLYRYVKTDENWDIRGSGSGSINVLAYSREAIDYENYHLITTRWELNTNIDTDVLEQII